MATSLIDQYCDAIEEWADITQRGVSDLIAYSMIHSGGVWYMLREGAVNDPMAPEHRGKTWGEVRGRFTLEQLRTHLRFLSDDVHIMEDALVCGLIDCVERQLSSLVHDYGPGLQRMRQEATRLEHMSKHPDEYEELIQAMDKSARVRGRAGFSAEDFSDMASLYWRMIARRPADEEAQRKSLLVAWQRVSAPIIDYENLERWYFEYLEGFTSGHHDQSED